MTDMYTDKPHQIAHLVGIHLVALPFYARVPPAVAALCACLTLWAVALIGGRAGQPGRKTLIALLVVASVAVAASYGTLLGRDPGTGLLLLLAFLKMFEIRAKRDVYVLVYLQFFIVASVFFHTQNPWVAVFVFATVIYLTSVLIMHNDGGALNLRRRLTVAGKMVIQSAPLMLVLFVLFPRVPGPLWTLPEDAAGATSGLDDEMSPGSISGLIISDEIAFRARFADKAPGLADLYWRGPAFDHYDGRVWSAGKTPLVTAPDLTPADTAAGHIRYTVTLEPHNRDWLFALDYPIDTDIGKSRLTREAQLRSAKAVNALTQYTVVSDRHAKNKSLTPLERAQNLGLPPAINPRTVALARQWRALSDADSGQIARRALRYFNTQPFEYTLTPPLLPGANAMDHFLFQTRSGFCEHYAAVFVFLMRAAGVPARVVTGYQGGEENPLEDYFIIRQSSAHAWAEVWIENDGWTRMDPTAAVSPDRINIGIQGAVTERGRLPDILTSENDLINALRYQWDSFNQQWNEWVVGFDLAKQKELLGLLGFAKPDWRDIVAALVILTALGGAATAWWVLRQAPTSGDLAVRAYLMFCAKLAKAGLARAGGEGPREYLARVKSGLNPAAARTAADITDLYTALRYGDGPAALAPQLAKKARGFRVGAAD